MNALRYYTPASERLNRVIKCDLCIYGGTSGGIAAAAQARRLGMRVVVLEQSERVGGMTSGGLSFTDIGNKHVIGGISREFYRRIGRHYGVEEHWRFEPKIASAVFHEWIEEEKIALYFTSFLARVEMKGQRISRLWTENGLEVSARMFMDCSYEGDLMAAARVSYAVGRESNQQYGETYNGAQIPPHYHQFLLPVSPYRVEGDSGSGLLEGIEPEQPVIGSGDRRIQAYNFRLCLSRDPQNQVPITEPPGYDRSRYELLARYCRAGHLPEFYKFDALVNGKADINNHGGFSTDLIGGNYAFPEGSWAERERIFQDHVAYTKGLLWFWKQDRDVPAAFQEPFNEWGWAGDEFEEYGGFSPTLYVREARRMVSDVVMTQHHCTGEMMVDDPVGMAAYTMDSHNTRRFVTPEGWVRNEGDVQVSGGAPYPISYRALVPRRGECENLLVPFCHSASHIAFGSTRMEPVFMILAQSCVHAVELALSKEISVQEVDRDSLRAVLEAQGQILETPQREGVGSLVG